MLEYYTCVCEIIPRGKSIIVRYYCNRITFLLFLESQFMYNNGRRQHDMADLLQRMDSPRRYCTLSTRIVAYNIYIYARNKTRGSL